MTMKVGFIGPKWVGYSLVRSSGYGAVQIPNEDSSAVNSTFTISDLDDRIAVSRTSGANSEIFHAKIEEPPDPSVEHCHSGDFQGQPVDDGGNKKARRTLMYASLMCLGFMIAEIIGGILSNSLAILTDAAHLLTDFASFMISLFALYMATRRPTRSMSFGWHRAEVLGAVVSVLLIWVITGILVYMAVLRIIYKEYNIDAKIMLITAAIGVSVNLIMGIMLSGSGHVHSHGGGGGHGHGHSHGGNKRKKKTKRSTTGSSIISGESRQGKTKAESVNINVRAAFIHVIGDLLQSVGVLIAAYVIYYHPDMAIMDPICTFVFSILVLYTTIQIMRDAVVVLMEGTPRGIDFGEVESSLKEIDGVLTVHNIRIWSLTMDKAAFSAHLAVDQSCDSHEVLKNASVMLKQEFNVYDCTLQIERFTVDMTECVHCNNPSG